MSSFSRTDTSVLGRWWWTVDRWALVALILLIGIGAILIMAASPGAAARMGLDPFHFARHQFVFLAPAIVVMLLASVMTPIGVRRTAAIGFVVGLILLAATLLFGAELNGAKRWISVAGLTLQPSELIKPSFAVVAAWMFAEHKNNAAFPGHWVATLLFILVAGLLIFQPDIGMTFTVTAVWLVQLFLAGLSLLWIALGAVVLVGAIAAAYLLLPHVASRVDRFLDPASGDTYQVDTSLDAFRNGGLLGRGPGEGVVKNLLPDAHTDFIFAVAGEELGVFACLAIVGLFAFIVLRGFSRVVREANLFVVLAVAGLLTQFGLQALINMGVTVRLLPTKGMTLPFVSYGGSSLLATALGMGMMLALTRRHVSHRGLLV